MGRGNFRNGVLGMIEQMPKGFQPGSMGEETADADDGDRRRAEGLRFIDIHGSIPENPSGCIDSRAAVIATGDVADVCFGRTGQRCFAGNGLLWHIGARCKRVCPAHCFLPFGNNNA